MNHPASPPKVRKHLMVPGQARPPGPSSHSTVMVQRWVVTVLTISIVFHLAGGLAFAAYYTNPDVPSSRIGLLVIAAVMGALAVGAVRAIHRKRLVTPWLVLGLLPSLLGTYFCFLR
jgi:uncharacterized membrane protein